MTKLKRISKPKMTMQESTYEEKVGSEPTNNISNIEKERSRCECDEFRVEKVKIFGSHHHFPGWPLFLYGDGCLR
jgi:hypothetical protein